MAETRPSAHVFPLRVYYEDTDAAGIVYYANYLKFAERARSELLRWLGTDNSTLQRDYDVVFAVRNCSVSYFGPARLDDSLEVRTEILAVGGATLSARQRVERAGEVLADMKIRLACLNSRGRPARLPRTIRNAFDGLSLGSTDGTNGTRHN